MRIIQHGTNFVLDTSLTHAYHMLMRDASNRRMDCGKLDFPYKGKLRNARTFLYKVRKKHIEDRSTLFFGNVYVGQIADQQGMVEALKDIMLSVRISPHDGQEYLYWKRKSAKIHWDKVIARSF